MCSVFVITLSDKNVSSKEPFESPQEFGLNGISDHAYEVGQWDKSYGEQQKLSLRGLQLLLQAIMMD